MIYAGDSIFIVVAYPTTDFCRSNTSHSRKTWLEKMKSQTFNGIPPTPPPPRKKERKRKKKLSQGKLNFSLEFISYKLLASPHEPPSSVKKPKAKRRKNHFGDPRRAHNSKDFWYFYRNFALFSFRIFS